MQRHRTTRRVRRSLLGVLGVCLGMAGCADQPRHQGAEADARAAMRWLGLEYSKFLVEHNGAPPRDAADLRKSIESHMGELKGFGIKSPDDLLKSFRDGEPLVVVAGKLAESADSSRLYWAGYEQRGVDGKILACNTRGGVFEFTAEEFAKLLPAK